jgi:preprotein translocase subunit YajC
VGTRVVLTSGLHGRIAQVQDDGFVIETLSGKLKFEKAAVSREFTEARFGDKSKTSDKAEDKKEIETEKK